MNKSIFQLVLAALFTALIIVGSIVAIPFVPVPVVLANFFALLAGLLLGPFWGSVSVLVFLALGAIGLPVFAGAKGGFTLFMAPTGGFLIGYLASALIAGLVAYGFTSKDAKGQTKAAPGIVRLTIAGFLGLIALYAVGLPWFQMVLSAKVTTLWAALIIMLPYLVGDVIKTVAAIALSAKLRPLLKL